MKTLGYRDSNSMRSSVYYTIDSRGSASIQKTKKEWEIELETRWSSWSDSDWRREYESASNDIIKGRERKIQKKKKTWILTLQKFLDRLLYKVEHKEVDDKKKGKNVEWNECTESKKQHTTEKEKKI